jgi:predicted kinase
MPPLLVVFAGLPGTGKSTLAGAVAERLDAIWLRVDVAGAAMVKAGLTRSFEAGLAAYIVAQDIAAVHLRLGRNVVLDAVNAVEPGRAMWRGLATEYGATLSVVETICSDSAEHRRRVETREAPTPPLPLPTWAEVVGLEYEDWKEPVLTIDTVVPTEECVTRILAHLAARGALR